MALEVAEAYVSILPSARGFGQALADQTEGPTNDVGKAAGASFGASFVGALGGLATVGVAVGAAVGAATIGAGVGLFKLGASFDDAFDKIRVGTGATGAQLENLQDLFKDVARQVPASMDEVATAVTTLTQKLGVTDWTQDLAAQVLNLSRITGTDLKGNLDAVTDVLLSFGISAADSGPKLDVLFRASQKTGVGVDRLAATMAEAGPNLQQLGLNFEESAGLVAIFGKAGVDVGAVMPALSRTIAQAAKDGKNAGDVFRETFARIRDAPSDTEAAGAAIDVFGARAGPKLAGLIREGKLGYEELAKAIAEGGDTINGAAADTADFAEQWGLFKNQVLIGLEPLATAVFGAVGDAMAAIGPKVGPAIDAVSEDLIAAFGVAEQVVSTFVAAFKSGGDDITSSGFNGAVEGVGLVLGNVYDWLKVKIPEAVDVFKAAFATAQTAISTTVDYVNTHKDAFATIAAGALAFAGALEAIKAAQAGISAAQGLGSLGTAIAPLLVAAGPIGLAVAAIAAVGVAGFVAYQKFEPFRNVIDSIGRVIRDVAIVAFNALVVAAQAVGSFVAGAFNAVRGAVDAVGGAFSRVAQFAGSLFSAVVTALTPLAQWFNTNVVSTLSAGVDLVVALFQRVSLFVTTAISTMVALAQPALALLGTAFQIMGTVISTVLEVLSTVISSTVSFWVGAISTFVDIVRPIWEAFFQNMLTIATVVFNIIRTVIETVLGVIRGIFQAITGLVSGDWGKFWEGIKTIASSLFGAVTGIIDAIWNGIKGIFSNAIDAVKSTVTNGFNEVVSFVSGIPGRVTSALGSLASTLYSAGEDLIRGLLNGVKNMAGAAADAAKNVVKGAVDAAKNFLGIGSPSKVFREIGINVGQGFVAGVERMGDDVEAAVRAQYGALTALTGTPLGMTADVGIGAAAGLRAPAPQWADGGGGEAARSGDVTVNVQSNADPWRIADELRWVRKTSGV